MRSFHSMNPLSSNKNTGVWTPPIGTQHLIEPAGVSRSQGEPNVAMFAYDNSGNFIPWVFSSNVAANTFGPVVDITDSNNFGSVPRRSLTIARPTRRSWEEARAVLRASQSLAWSTSQGAPSANSRELDLAS